MALVAIRINSVLGAPSPAFDGEGNAIDGDSWELNDSEEEMIWVDASDFWDIENGITDLRDILRGWNDKKPEAAEAT